MTKNNFEEEKAKLRKKIWDLLEKQHVARFPLPCKGRIPNFDGSEQAALKLNELSEWKQAKVIVANPDYAQKPVRELALKQGKQLIMATPKLKRGYLLIKAKEVKGKEDFASTIKGAFKYGSKLEQPPKPDLIVTGCVAVAKDFYRLGKGGGYGDKEITTFQARYGKIPVLTTIHDLQLVDKQPVMPYDTQVDIVVTPTQILRKDK